MLEPVLDLWLRLHFYEKVSFLGFIIFWLVIYISEISFFLRRKPRTKSKVRRLIHAFAIIGLVCLAYAYFIEPNWIDVRRIGVHTNKLKQTSFTVVHISDLHCETKLRNEQKLVKIINGINPDLIVFTGDSLNSPEALTNLQNTLKGLKAGLGKFAVKGNWDVWYWHKLDLFEGTDFIELNKNSRILEKNGERITVSGAAVNSVWEGLTFPRDTYSIFLHHYPDFIEDIAPLGADLYLAGHTHGGQVALPFYGAIITFSKFGKKYEAGQYKVGNTVLYINRGLGMDGGMFPRIRFWARPEITVFKISPQ